MRDIFICHASEDKEYIVRNMVEAFTEAKISCWYDEAEIQWGDSITQKVNEGLQMSQYVVVVFSTAFVGKNWPAKELNSVLNMEATTGSVKVLPLLVGTEQEKAEILSQFPLLNDKRYLQFDGDMRTIVRAMHSRLNSNNEHANSDTVSTRPIPVSGIPLPKIKKQFTQRDKDLFLHNAFTVVRQYFQRGLKELAANYEDVDTDFIEVHNLKFLATIYVRGEVASRCKIWLGGIASSDAIAYHSGQFNIDNDNSFNDILSVTHNNQTLGFSTSGMWSGGQDYSKEEILSAERVAEYLWRKSTDSI